MKQTEEKKPANATIPDKTTWESFSHHVSSRASANLTPLVSSKV